MYTWLFCHKWTFVVLLGMVAGLSLFQQSKDPKDVTSEVVHSRVDTSRLGRHALPLRRGMYADQRKFKDESHFYIEFCAVPARGSGLFWKPGHVFVSFFEHTPSGRLQSRGMVGMYPVNKLVGMGSFFFGPLPGGLENELYRKSIYRTTRRLIIRVDSNQFGAAWDVQKKWSAEDVYQLVAHDCVTFMDEIAFVLGLETPPRFPYLLPFDYLEALMNRNKDIIRTFPEL